MADFSVISTKTQTSTNTNDKNQEIQQQDINMFRGFDIVIDPSDHFYINNKKGGDCFTHPSSRVHKKIMQEWKILEKHVPDSIYVRVYENRIDLLRAVIVGPSGTPYHDGLYFFDIAFPSDYPFTPPLVYYKSFGLRINPNLYQNGKVCLSLLNTWVGEKCEKWNHNQSTILQVLISIQALVLNEKPYYNEPGMRTCEKKSNEYSENAFILSCKTMLYLLRRPPKNFEGFVTSHFREKASVILSACNAYSNGQVKVGYYGKDGSCPASCPTVRVSRKFKGSIYKLYPELLSNFRSNGASLTEIDSMEQLILTKKRTGLLKGKVGVKESGYVRMVFGKVMKFLGLNKNGSGKRDVEAETQT
ncbi:unnamed protein product [Dovyalis caffra]|uniref:UBC core domain-containing protein n=1 Tax=Dovyalis caffra TaxID=77055 RepID=A0AAV1QYY0_9ROSI|nr:unnamed protein product [Dovyalis caffra]